MKELDRIKTVRTSSRFSTDTFSIRSHYEEELRKYNKTHHVYEVDPYADVFQYRDNLYCILTESLDGMGNPWSYLLIGPEKAMLIDTSFGLGDLKGLCEYLAPGKELVVVNTHGHFDHAYGNNQFDEVWCHEKEAPLIEKLAKDPHIWDYLFDENGRGKWADFEKNDMIPYREYKVNGVPDGYIFNLGEDYEVELIWLPGHTPGHAAFLDKKGRMLFGGDHLCYGGGLMLGPASGFQDLDRQMQKIMNRKNEFNGVFTGHGPLDMSPYVLDPIARAVHEIAENPENFDARMEREFGGRKMTSYVKYMFHGDSIAYSMG